MHQIVAEAAAGAAAARHPAPLEEAEEPVMLPLTEILLSFTAFY